MTEDATVVLDAIEQEAGDDTRCCYKISKEEGQKKCVSDCDAPKFAVET